MPGWQPEVNGTLRSETQKVKNIGVFEKVNCNVLFRKSSPLKLIIMKGIQKKFLNFQYSKINVFELCSYHSLLRKTLHWQHLKVNILEIL